MTYSIIGFLAIIILLISNRDILHSRAGSVDPAGLGNLDPIGVGNTDPAGRGLSQAEQSYRSFLLGVLAYYITDACWGLLESHHLTQILYADTVIHFAAMAAAVWMWTIYVIAYLDRGDAFERLLQHTGRLFFAFEITVILINFFTPILFSFDAAGAYHAGPARYATLGIQILMFLITSIYTLTVAARTEGRTRLRHMTIGLFGIAMMAMIGIQVFYPLLPFYAIGYMLGTCLLHSFVVEDEKEEYRRELEASREALTEALAAAEHANKAKTAFLSNMSHEIRTPMNAIIGLNNIAMNDPTASGRVREYLDKIGSSAQHLLGIINDILDMSRIESGRMTIKKEEFSFAKSLEQVNTMISGQCRDKGLNYDCVINGQVDDYYVGDEMKLKQVLINILGNAVKFTPEGGEVKFVIEEIARYDGHVTVRFTVSDTGIGMSEEYLPKIFEAFSQEDSSSTSRYGSTGLGMPITKSIVELMNGEIEVQSEKGVGTTFTVTVTLGESGRRSIDTADGDFDPRDMRVLVIDDDRIALEHAEIVLGQVGISCDTAESGWEGIDKVRIRCSRREDYNLILIDWRMPELDGIETTRHIREIAGDRAPIIILTSFNWDDIADEAREAGVDSFVAKPLFAGSVVEQFREAFRLKSEHLAEQTADITGKRVLLAEDVAVNAEIMLMVLSMREIEADHAENGRIAVEMYESHEPGYYDAVLIDMRMPEMDGLEATRAIRSSGREDSQTIPIIALTANAFDEDVQRSMQAGLNAHLSKPVDPEILFKTLESLTVRR